MSSEDVLPILFSFISVVALIRFGLVIPIWNAIKSGLLWVVTPRKIERRTLQQIEFKTDMKWYEIRWSIARLEHELYPDGGEAWTHDVEDCVDPKCNPKHLRQMRDGRMVTAPAPPRNGGMPVLKSPPPPPPPPKFSEGGVVQGYRTEYMCLVCGTMSDGYKCARCSQGSGYYSNRPQQDDLPF